MQNGSVYLNFGYFFRFLVCLFGIKQGPPVKDHKTSVWTHRKTAFWKCGSRICVKGLPETFRVHCLKKNGRKFALNYAGVGAGRSTKNSIIFKFCCIPVGHALSDQKVWTNWISNSACKFKRVRLKRDPSVHVQCMYTLMRICAHVGTQDANLTIFGSATAWCGFHGWVFWGFFLHFTKWAAALQCSTAILA